MMFFPRRTPKDFQAADAILELFSSEFARWVYTVQALSDIYEHDTGARIVRDTYDSDYEAHIYANNVEVSLTRSHKRRVRNIVRDHNDADNRVAIQACLDAISAYRATGIEIPPVDDATGD